MPAPRGRLFLKYVLSFVGIVSVVLLLSGLLDGWFSYRETRQTLALIQHSKAEAAAQRIEQFILEIERQIGWTTHAQWAAGTVDQRRFDYVRLLRQVPAITELVQIDGQGREQLKVSRLAMDVVASNADYSADPRYVGATQQRIWYSPVYFRKESEPYMTIAIARAGRQAGVTLAEVNLKLIWDVVTAIRLGQTGYAYVLDGQGRLIAHPDISLVLRNTDLSALPQVIAARAAADLRSPEERATIVPALDGRSVFSAAAAITKLVWFVFVETPVNEALQPLYDTMIRTGLLLLLGLAVAALGGVLFARRMLTPVRALAAGAARLGTGDLAHRIDVRTGDELQALGDSFNRMAGQLQQSYAGLEQKVADRTAELQQTLEYQTATSEVLKAISRTTFDLDAVLTTLATTATRLCQAQHASMFRLERGAYRWVAGHGLTPEYLALERAAIIHPGRDTIVGRAALERQTVQILDAWTDPDYAVKDEARVGGVRSMIGVPLMRAGEPIGVIALARNAIEAFTPKQIELVTVFADQAVIAMENMRLFEEVRARTNELAQSVEELRALGEISQAVNSTLDAPTVLETIVTKAVQISGTSAGVIYVYSARQEAFRMRASWGGDEALTKAMRKQRIGMDTPVGEAARTREPVQLPELRDAPATPIIDLLLAAGYRALLIVPLVGPERVIGVLIIRRKQPGLFPERTVDLMRTFAAQSVLAIQNARLFGEIEEKSRQLQIASQHKSQFLANMSHELRTPLNAVLGYTELIADGIYGEVPAKALAVLERVQANGKHLLGLINDVLDLSKIEAGQLELAVDDYAVPTVVQSVIAATESLARAKNLELRIALAEGLPTGRGDERRLAQVLLNLVGNAIKFTDNGFVEIAARLDGDRFEIAVRDSGPGIAPEDQRRIFEEFQQVDSSNTRKKGGTGLGLAISRRIVEMHGGTIGVASALGTGSTFTIAIPIRVAAQREAAQ